MEEIKVGRKINLEMKSCFNNGKRIHRKILKYNFFDVDKLRDIYKINSVIVKEKDFSQIDLIIKFCRVTFLPLKIYTNYSIPNKIIKKLEDNLIIYKICKLYSF